MGAKLGVRAGVPVGEALVAFAHDVVQEGRQAVDNPDNTEAVAVHDFRKAMKRWRAVLRLLEPMVGLDARRLRDEARDLARELAAARDAQSALDAMADLEGVEQALSARTQQSIRARLDAARQAAETVALTAEMRERLRAALDTARRAVDHWPLQGVEFWHVVEALGASYSRARGAVPASWSEASDEELHTLRQRVVVHRYQMQLIEPLWPRLGRVWIAEAQRLRERLGTHQDLAVLTRLTGPHQPLAPWRSRLAPLIAARKAAHVVAAARLTGRLFAEKPRAFRRRLQALWDNVAVA